MAQFDFSIVGIVHLVLIGNSETGSQRRVAVHVSAHERPRSAGSRHMAVSHERMGSPPAGQPLERPGTGECNGHEMLRDGLHRKAAHPGLPFVIGLSMAGLRRPVGFSRPAHPPPRSRALSCGPRWICM